MKISSRDNKRRDECDHCPWNGTKSGFLLSAILSLSAAKALWSLNITAELACLLNMKIQLSVRQSNRFSCLSSFITRLNIFESLNFIGQFLLYRQKGMSVRKFRLSLRGNARFHYNWRGEVNEFFQCIQIAFHSNSSNTREYKHTYQAHISSSHISEQIREN